MYPNRSHEAVACERFRAISQSFVDAGSLQRPKRFPERRGRVPDLAVQQARCLALSAAGLEELGADKTLVFTVRAEGVRECKEAVQGVAGVAAGKGEVASCSGCRVAPVQQRVVILPQLSPPSPWGWALDFVCPSEEREQRECVLPRGPPRQSQRCIIQAKPIRAVPQPPRELGSGRIGADRPHEGGLDHQPRWPLAASR